MSRICILYVYFLAIYVYFESLFAQFEAVDKIGD